MLPVVSKIIERHVHHSFYEYLNEHNLINEIQSGFREKHPCETAWHCIIENSLHDIDSGNSTSVLYIYLSKAFDTVNHEVLLHRLFSFCVCSNTYSWFKSCLENRLQCVRWKSIHTNKKPINICVPQGSILGPLFCIVFVNDYPECLQYSETHMYADDKTQDVSGKSIDVIETKLRADLLNSMKWMGKNKLTMNL